MKPTACMPVICNASASTSSLSLSPWGEYDCDVAALILNCSNLSTCVLVLIPLLELLISVCITFCKLSLLQLR